MSDRFTYGVEKIGTRIECSNLVTWLISPWNGSKGMKVTHTKAHLSKHLGFKSTLMTLSCGPDDDWVRHECDFDTLWTKPPVLDVFYSERTCTHAERGLVRQYE